MVPTWATPCALLRPHVENPIGPGSELGNKLGNFCTGNFKNDTLGPLRITESKLKSSQTYWDFFFGVCVTKKCCEFTQKKFSSLKTDFLLLKQVNLTFQVNIPPLPLRKVNIRVLTRIFPVLFLSVWKILFIY